MSTTLYPFPRPPTSLKAPIQRVVRFFDETGYVVVEIRLCHRAFSEFSTGTPLTTGGKILHRLPKNRLGMLTFFGVFKRMVPKSLAAIGEAPTQEGHIPFRAFPRLRMDHTY